jgi:hypothetical protein
MADLPDFLTLHHNCDRSGIYEVPIRRAGTSLIALFCLAGLLEEEVAAAARLQNIASLAQVKWAVLETGGQISFIKN